MKDQVVTTIRRCPVCGEDATYVEATTERLEDYGDGGPPGPPNDPRRAVMRPYRRSVPGRTSTRYEPCGHVA